MTTPTAPAPGTLPTVQVILNTDGTGLIDAAGNVTPITAPDTDVARDAMRVRLRQLATQVGRPIPVTIVDYSLPAAQHLQHLWWNMDGTATPREEEPPPAPVRPLRPVTQLPTPEPLPEDPVSAHRNPEPHPEMVPPLAESDRWQEEPRPRSVREPETLPEPPQSVPDVTLPPAERTRPSFDDLMAARPDPANAPAQIGLRGLLREISGGRWRLAPSPRERERRALEARVQQPLDGSKTIVVVNPKGGAGKTSAVLQLARKLGSLRGGGVVAWDNNETRGTLGWRSMQAAHEHTVTHLIDAIHEHGASWPGGIAELRRYLRSQGPAMFDVLASDESTLQDRHGAVTISAGDHDAVHGVLSRFYELVIEDTGNNMRAPNWGAAVMRADQLVIVSTVREDTAQSAGWLAQGLIETGREELLHNAVTVLAAPTDGGHHGDLHKRFYNHFKDLTREVVDVPYDAALAEGRPIDYNALSDRTQQTWLEVAAAVVDGL